MRCLYHAARNVYISHYDEAYSAKRGPAVSEQKACWLFEADFGEGLRGYVPTSSYVSMARQRESSDPAKLQARLAEDEQAGTLACVWTLETRRALHYCHRNEAQPVIITYYCMADARRVVRPGLPCVFSCRPTGQAGSLSKFDLRHRRFAGRSSVMTAMCALQVSEGAMAAVRKKAWQAPRRSGNNRWYAIGARAS